MAKEYLKQLSGLMQPLTSGMFDDVKPECKHFFSGAALYVDDRICITLTPAGFAIKLPEALRSEVLKRKGVEKLQYFPSGPVKKEYAVLSKEILSNKAEMQVLVRQSVEFVLSLPKPYHSLLRKEVK